MKQIIIFLSLVLLAGCSNELTEELQWRVDFLYAHTIEMERLSSPKMLQELRLDISYLQGENLTTAEKISQLEQAYGMKTSGSRENRITQLEMRMNEMMEGWVEQIR